MQELVPSYYPKFRCIADRCRHSCCIGWEIDIDPETLERYDDPTVPIFRRFQTDIDRTDPPHFRLDEKERCPFLNQCGLCDIILQMGEDSLCQICADHPRFRNFFSGRTETGLGLCCEAAAELILFRKEPFVLRALTDGEDPETLTEEETEFLFLRDQIFSVLQNRRKPIGTRLRETEDLMGIRLPDKTIREWAENYRSLEQLDPLWNNILDILMKDESPSDLPYNETPWEIPLENLAVYFVFRHLADALDDERLEARLAFCTLSVRILYAIYRNILTEKGQVTTEDIIDAARLYSSEIEYSEDNMETLFGILQES
ncbi:MAG: flagellin lysine-N-methylase [Clostridia bacterium]|nr:flagellin lysine-N-methylase [Clostridia bacterium]